jgi:prevent-host-death family protein
VTNRIWSLRDAKNRFSEVVNRAISDGPQVVTRRGEEVVVVMAKSEFARLQDSRPGLVRFLRESPLVGVDLDLERDRSLLRDQEL